MRKTLLLLNMGGPSNLDEVEVFLQNMFSDKHILPVNPIIRSLIRMIIVKKRLEEAKENYRELGEKSPLLGITNSLIHKLSEKLHLPIFAAMRYVPPFAKDALLECKRQGIEELLLFPMYPHYSTTTTLSSVEDVKEQCRELDYFPVIKVIEPYYNDRDYIDLCIEQILTATEGIERSTYQLLLSAHGLPVSIIEAGDPYEKHITANVESIKNALAERDIVFADIELVYQSKVGPSKWLEPNLVDVLRNPKYLKVVVYPLAFTIDNSETDFELDIEHREIAHKIGYEDYRVVKCFNASDSFVELIVKRVRGLE